jgi:AraC-like DNA-binding protein
VRPDRARESLGGELARVVPAPALQRFVRAYRFFDLDASLSYTVPAWTRNTMLFNYGDSFHAYFPEGRAVPVLGVALLGPTTKPLCYGELAGRYRFAAVEFHPLVMARLIREEIHHLTDTLIDAESAFGVRRVSAILEELGSAASDMDRAAALDRFLLSIRPDNAVAPEEKELDLLQLIRKAQAPFSISRLSEEIGHSERTLRRKFHAAIGLSPQSYFVIHRAERVIFHLYYRPESPTHEIALTTGFADESHLSHDLRRLTGNTPRQIRQQRQGGIAHLRDFFHPTAL